MERHVTRPARADARRVLQGAGRIRAGAPAPPGRRPHRVLPGRTCCAVRAARPRPTPTTASRWRSGSPGRCRPAARSSGPGCAASAISRCSLPGSSPTASPGAHVDVDYYVSMGEYAYGSLSRAEDAFREVFAELARKFVGFSDVLADISERHGADLEQRRAAALREVAAHRQRTATASGSSSGASSPTARSASGSSSSRRVLRFPSAGVVLRCERSNTSVISYTARTAMRPNRIGGTGV